MTATTSSNFRITLTEQRGPDGRLSEKCIGHHPGYYDRPAQNQCSNALGQSALAVSDSSFFINAKSCMSLIGALPVHLWFKGHPGQPVFQPSVHAVNQGRQLVRSDIHLRLPYGDDVSFCPAGKFVQFLPGKTSDNLEFPHLR